jgi:DNA-directed RNA polymerase subunit RPC12/RpoP
LLEEERWSSEGEEDRAFPTSLRARLKAVFASSLDIVVPMSAMSLEDKGGDVSACTASLKALSMEEGHRCPRCKHRFALKKTRDLHMKVCRE